MGVGRTERQGHWGLLPCPVPAVEVDVVRACVPCGRNPTPAWPGFQGPVGAAAGGMDVSPGKHSLRCLLLSSFACHCTLVAHSGSLPGAPALPPRFLPGSHGHRMYGLRARGTRGTRHPTWPAARTSSRHACQPSIIHTQVSLSEPDSWAPENPWCQPPAHFPIWNADLAQSQRFVIFLEDLGTPHLYIC